MSKPRRSSADTLTGDMFASADAFVFPRAAAPIDGSMNFRAEVSHLVSDMLKDAHSAGIDRFEVASRASRLTGRDVSKLMLDGYTSESREEFNLPLWLAPVLEIVCGDTRLAAWHGGKIGGQLMLGSAAIDAEIGRLEGQRLRAADQLKQLRELRRKVR
jgi:hypothetical protein